MKQSILFIRSFLILFISSVFLFSCAIDQEKNPDVLPALEISNVPYGSDTRQKMDIFLPAGRSSDKTPVIIYIHGGAWIDGDKSEFLQVKPLVEQSFPGFAMISFNYRLFDFVSKQNRFPAQEEDVKAALQFIRSKLKEWNISEKIILSGASAGGHLALLHGLKNKESDIKGLIAFFPPTDLTSLFGFNNLTTLGLTEIMGGTPLTVPANYQNASPVNFASSEDPPIIFFHGETDQVVPISQSEKLETALKNVQIRHQFIRVPNQGHGFAADTNAALLRQAKSFLGEL
ncbi:prolyl oligopeptidase family serine peptidase [Algoriphagus aquatilis]|uniref:Prolyl oligopeptidase family serine peptidase n=1 Tax=Algoriphagus aquatilis TaxID=490186 RepID=A0ABW0BV27_9BACT